MLTFFILLLIYGAMALHSGLVLAHYLLLGHWPESWIPWRCELWEDVDEEIEELYAVPAAPCADCGGIGGAHLKTCPQVIKPT
ncbi:MAG TPA: hypothetical protein VJ742_12680 [Nitrososphaera sp.]|nr:hypothetical protein [Nitrososphaera sp.]